MIEASDRPGGVCRSISVEGGLGRWWFETGGGHWVFGGDPMLNQFLNRFARWKPHVRRSSVWLSELDLFVPYPIQNNLHALPESLRRDIWREMQAASSARPAVLGEWLENAFGPKLAGLFFRPFHDLYTAGLTGVVAADDFFKTPVDLAQVELGLTAGAAQVGYNQTFLYPEHGLSSFVAGLESECHVQCDSPVTSIDTESRQVEIGGSARHSYKVILSTLPLHTALHVVGVDSGEADPHTAVLVLNIGARKGPSCPDDHWVYLPRSRSGFHRVGFYHNVDPYFVPAGRSDLASLYVERAFPSGTTPEPYYAQAAIAALQQMGWIGDVDALQESWVDVAYTWRRPGSRWREDGIAALAKRGIFQAGRYARWRFQGIADSLREGLQAGALLRTAM